MEAILNAAIWLPAVGALVTAIWPGNSRGSRWIAVIASGATLLLALALFVAFDSQQLGRQGGALPMAFTTNVPWIAPFGINYHVGLDGLSLPMFVLNALLVFIAVLVSWNTALRPREYFALLLVLETAVFGVFASLDFFLFFLFWELELVPMFFLIGIWGGARRDYAAMKFILYTIAGSAFMLVGILVLYFGSPVHSFDLTVLAAQRLGPELQLIVWLFLFVGFAVKVPLFPFHTWLPDAHTEAPTAISVLLAGILLKMGAYGLLRMNLSLLPDATRTLAMGLAVLAVISIIYGALVAMMQTDLKRVIANSSISHMGYVILGASALTPIGLEGAVFQMFTHGTITALLFIMVGLVYDRAHTREIAALGGLATRMPFVAVGFVVAGLASLGLPGMSGFVAEFLVFVGSFPVWPLGTAIGIFTIVITAGYILWLLQRVFFGPERSEWRQIGDANALEKVTVSVLIVTIVGVGLLPSIIGTIIVSGIGPIAARYWGS